jgi:hypothetical protein
MQLDQKWVANCTHEYFLLSETPVFTGFTANIFFPYSLYGKQFLPGAEANCRFAFGQHDLAEGSPAEKFDELVLIHTRSVVISIAVFQFFSLQTYNTIICISLN